MQIQINCPVLSSPSVFHNLSIDRSQNISPFIPQCDCFLPEQTRGRHERSSKLGRFLRVFPRFPAIEGTHRVFPSRCLREHAAENVYEVVQPPQVAVLPVALLPGRPVVQRLRLWQRDRLPKVNHPDSGLPGGVVYKQQGAAHHLQRTHGQVQA